MDAGDTYIPRQPRETLLWPEGEVMQLFRCRDQLDAGGVCLAGRLGDGKVDSSIDVP